MICPNCRRTYVDPVKYHRHLVDELRGLKEDFDRLVWESRMKLEMLSRVSGIAYKGVKP